ncbi:PREDICTED: ejaculatory bulb-specific protein 3-like [Dufourea novaeangliae]|uniref:Putative odorant-binding protein A10 n=1 Tax=Dufourea novaeangliae TaxID=178035 RepID=A0A154PHT4_DUFNO|nr:PREDICTED: ejaculatory bulb-specific protein 3-like [Dufourea novaeangliae]KZC11372.1 Putative odorant-binding protein A10 [Dufourea novaeangliae]
MRYYIVLLSFCLLAWAHAEELYDDKYDDIDINEILSNERLREQYYKCFMDTAPCVTADAVFFKANLPEAVATQCKKCTEKQKNTFDVMADWYNKNQPDKWTAFIERMVINAKKPNKRSA